MIFPSYQAGSASNMQINAPIWISPDRAYAAGFITGGADSATTGKLVNLVQQALPAGNVWCNAIPQGNHPHSDWVLGWMGQGIIVQRVELDRTQVNPLATDILSVPAGSNAAARLVETIQAGQVVFAPLG